MRWNREVVHESDFAYSVYTAKHGEKRAEIRVLDGGTGDKTYGGDLLLERRISEATRKAPEEWETIVDREWFQTYAQARKVAEEWLTE